MIKKMKVVWKTFYFLFSLDFLECTSQFGKFICWFEWVSVECYCLYCCFIFILDLLLVIPYKISCSCLIWYEVMCMAFSGSQAFFCCTILTLQLLSVIINNLHIWIVEMFIIRSYLFLQLQAKTQKEDSEDTRWCWIRRRDKEENCNWKGEIFLRFCSAKTGLLVEIVHYHPHFCRNVRNAWSLCEDSFLLRHLKWALTAVMGIYQKVQVLKFLVMQ